MKRIECKLLCPFFYFMRSPINRLDFNGYRVRPKVMAKPGILFAARLWFKFTTEKVVFFICRTYNCYDKYI